jgi:chromosome partitioning protein
LFPVAASWYPGNVVAVALVSTKGGVGKSTLACHLAVASQRAGHRTAILDADPQGSASAWGAQRTADYPAVVTADASEVANAIVEARSGSFKRVWVDTAPRLSPGLEKLVAACDWSLIPVKPSAFDVATAKATAELVAGAGKRFAFVVNEAPPERLGVRSREVSEARAFLGEIGPVLETVIGDRLAYRRALESGLSVQEVDDTSPAAGEIADAFTEIERLIHGS